jgi:hypothetical protein
MGLAAAGVVTVVVAGGGVLAHAQSAHTAAAEGGLAVSPVTIERPAQAGAAIVKVTNDSSKPLAISVAARPWIQSSSGAVAPNRAKTLGTVGVSDSSFMLAAGASKSVTVTLKSAAATYGSVEVIGLPTDAATRKGLVTGYRILGALRYDPAVPVHSLKPGAVKVTKDSITLAVKNAGNTLDPVTGTVAVKGPLGTKNGSIKAVRILPGKSVAMPLASAKTLSKGSYTATIALTQAGKSIKLVKKVKVTR